MIDDDKPPLGELQHFGIPGMRWGQRKAQLPSVSIQAQARHIARRDAGVVVAREVMRNYGKYALPATGKIVKGTAVGLVEYGPRVAKGSAFSLRLLGKSAKVLARGGKSYVKGAVAIAKAFR